MGRQPSRRCCASSRSVRRCMRSAFPLPARSPWWRPAIRLRGTRCCPARCSLVSRPAISASARLSTRRRRVTRRSCGPWAFMDAFEPATVFSSIDHGGRYAYGNQPQVAQWNLARFAETLLPLFDAETDTALAAATEVLQSFPGRFQEYWELGMGAKLGITASRPEGGAVIGELFGLLQGQQVDFTSCFRALSSAVLGDAARARSLFQEPSAFDAWADRWRAQLSLQASDPRVIAAAMDRANPVYIPRNHQVEKALAAASAGDLRPFWRLLDVLGQPFDERPGLEPYAAPAPPNGAYRTFCGT